MKFSFAGRCGLLLFIFANLTFMLLGCGLVIVGSTMKVNSDVIDKTDVQSVLNDVSFNGQLRLGTVVSYVSILTIALGGVIVLVSVFGFCWTCCGKQCMLVTYAVIMVLILMLNIVLLAMWATLHERANNNVKGELETVFTKYEGFTSTKSVSMGWDLLFIGLDCCGVEKVGADNRLEFQHTVWYTYRDTKEIPYSCCKVATENDYKTGTDNSCTDGHYIAVNNKGCYDAFKDWLNNYTVPGSVIAGFLIVVEVVLAVYPFILCHDIDKKNTIV